VEHKNPSEQKRTTLANVVLILVTSIKK